MSKYFRKTGFVFFIFIINFINAQVPANKLGLNRPGILWKYIENESFKIIYPSSMDSQALRVGSIIQKLSDSHDKGIGKKTIKTDIILHPETTIPNGFVTVGPFRSEFYTTPPQYFSTTNWLDLLAIHEFRHIKQFSNAQSGLTKLGKSILGSWTWGGMIGTALPRWFMEGDAVLMETALTRSGRGRLPSFDMEYKTLIFEKKNYSYEKASAGSFKDFVPDWYKLGYYMTLYGSKNFGQNLWAETVNDAIRYKGLFFPFNKSLKKSTGLNTHQLYEKTLQNLTAQWEILNPNFEYIQIPHKTKKTVTDYYLPTYTPTGKLIVAKKSFQQWPQLITLDSLGNEKKLTSLGITFDPLNGSLSANEEYIIWSELFIDPRWHNRQFYDLVKYNFKEGSKKRLTKGKRYFSPSISPQFNRIATIEIGQNQSVYLSIINGDNGKEIIKISAGEYNLLSFPAWVNENEIVVIGNINETSALLLLNLENQNFTPLTPFLPFAISHPKIKENKVYFSAAYLPENNIYTYDFESQKIQKITSHPIGSFQPEINPLTSEVAFCGFSSNGYELYRINPIGIDFNPIKESLAISNIDPIALEEGGTILDELESLNLEPKKLNPFSGLINPHSILPYIQPPVGGLRILSDNIMSTASAELAGYFNFNEHLPVITGTFTYAGWYPEIRGNIGSLYRRANFASFSIPNDTTLQLNQYSQLWQENRIGGGLRLPLQKIGGSYDSRFLVELNYQKIGLNLNREEPVFINQDTLTGSVSGVSRFKKFVFEPIQKDQIHSFHTRVLLRHFKRTAKQELGSNFGIHLEWNQRWGNGTVLQGSQSLVRGDLYIPGIAKTHSLYFQTLYQKEKYLNNYKYPNLFFYPRGYRVQLGEEVFKWGVNYSFPLWYPDIAIGPLAFLQRISINGFYDHALIRLSDPFTFNRTIQSTGVEILGDFRLFRLLDVRAGIRYSYPFQPQYTENQKSHQFDFFIINISG
ncbi:MAG: hypothetical protein RJA52_988 [Bacteroidota bacterium]